MCDHFRELTLHRILDAISLVREGQSSDPHVLFEPSICFFTFDLKLIAGCFDLESAGTIILVN